MNKYNRVTIVCGHYGVGKTTFSINYSMYIRNYTSKNIYIADLDVVNPYFRSREHSSYLEEKNIKVIGSYLPQSGADIPAVSAEVYSIFDKKDVIGIIDMGGNSAGSLSFASFRNNVDVNETDVFFVFNANRKENSTFELALGYLIDIESVLGLKVTGIINNTHLMDDTSLDDIEKGEIIADKLSKEKNIPIKFTCINNKFYHNNSKIFTKYDLFIMDYDIKNKI
ncbi:ATP/GTP-binding protein [Brachyspira hyodysenteriae]|uniref:ATP/GTP-binding protein n=1 Tax=Brachyspira hyodysenteriae TaxID=159 RepID=UPI0022CDADC7|nr:ATP/GTP-binding protein [Brachyspira hyodysenteriae]MCZ9839810.1 ATP/GTP-binding protein [Brachyspira hyodysenteriae]MCZ9847452.1 ATP/GTP-binding protein [Brachyspira hyodysenteriae]MCZ9850962.1 ATP/GTP-binding protein [Brachyspira hyodysenteriae]MCZ9860285.1 ATP/GTP-binding protein [Brachyspira hyodysenteriae]MCZ9869433.1 ATP/GTP-binding protein [Brachyspira hyodysenteriae]